MYRPPEENETLLTVTMVVLSLAILFAIYHFNPYFMNNKPLSESMIEAKEHSQPIPPINSEPESLTGEWFNFGAQSFNHTQIQDPQRQVNSNLVREFARAFAENDEKMVPDWTVSEKGVLANLGDSIVFYLPDMTRVWTFELRDGEKAIDRPLIRDNDVFFVSDTGVLYRLNASTGRLKWMIELQGSAVHAPTPYHAHLFIVMRDGESYFIGKYSALNGELMWRKPLVGLTGPNPIAISEPTKLILVTDSNGSLLCLDLNNGNAYWQEKKLGTLKAPASTMGELAFVANGEGKAFGIQLRKKERAWEYELKSGSKSPISYVPSHGFIAVLTNSGYLHAIEARTGEGQWQYNTNNSQPDQSVTAVRLNNEGIQKYSLKWNHQGWTLWSPCQDDSLCVFNPENGSVKVRLQLRGKVASSLQFLDGHLHLTLKDPQKLPWITDDQPMPRISFAKFRPHTGGKTPAAPPSGI